MSRLRWNAGQIVQDKNDIGIEGIDYFKVGASYYTEDFVKELFNKINIYKTRIEKAVEYIEKEKSCYMRSCDISNATNREGLIISSAVRTCDDTLKILRGNNDK